MTMRFILPLLIGAVTVAPAGAAISPVAPQARAYGKNTVIPFAANGGIRDWHAEDDRSIYLMDRTGRWYLATLSGTCHGLRLNQTLAFETDPIGTFDTFSAIRTRDLRCHVAKLVHARRPAAKGGKGKN